ncbi:hypothetical protein TL16_g05084 [Triparma laevis f. inornata]|uniref:Uncharacterized protein n=1 Tax=Triparma laevis f. inornata TaxID=1714386 RepID=A0A9W7ABC7_9STRA|nr:hypothetical protein TL16_g05084 [Triparma laevis f. inornata]
MPPHSAQMGDTVGKLFSGYGYREGKIREILEQTPTKCVVDWYNPESIYVTTEEISALKFTAHQEEETKEEKTKEKKVPSKTSATPSKTTTSKKRKSNKIDDAEMDDIDQYKMPDLVGKRIAKFFDDELFYGKLVTREKVTAQRTGMNLGYHYHVEYDDMNEEDIIAQDARECISLYEMDKKNKSESKKRTSKLTPRNFANPFPSYSHSNQ